MCFVDNGFRSKLEGGPDPGGGGGGGGIPPDGGGGGGGGGGPATLAFTG